MNRTAPRPSVLSTSLARLAFGVAALAFATPPAAAGPITAGASRVSYEVAGSVGSAGVDGAPAVRFVPASGEVDPASPFSLGSFAVDAPAGGATTTYRQTPVTIELWARAIGGASTGGPGGAADPIVVHGWLSGTAGAAGSSLSLWLDQGVQPADPRFYQPRPLPPFPAGSAFGGGGGGAAPAYLGLNRGESLLRLDPTAGASTPVLAELTLAPNVPEPAAPLILGGLGLALAAGRVVDARLRAAR